MFSLFLYVVRIGERAMHQIANISHMQYPRKHIRLAEIDPYIALQGSFAIHGLIGDATVGFTVLILEMCFKHSILLNHPSIVNR
jgi:hypothetical protein